jgi:Raf kinase inhibitor-like YbhB/YbcL family protein
MNIGELVISSPAFDDGGRIPTRHTQEAEDVSPELRWTGVPAGTRQLALIVHDPDAPLPQGWTHWTLYALPADTTGLAEGDTGGGLEGATTSGSGGYRGPMPPEGHGVHRYYFWLYALDTELDPEPGRTREELLAAMDGHVLEQARLVGTYERQ